MGLGDPAQQPGGDHGARQDPVAGESRQLSGLLAQERTDLIAGQLTPAAGGVRVRDGGRAAVGVGVVGDHQVRLNLPRLVQRQVQSPGFLRVGEGDCREVRVGLELLSYLDDVGEPDPSKYLTTGGPAHAVHRCQNDPHRGRGLHPGRLGCPLDVLLTNGRVDRLPARLRARHRGNRTDGVDGLRDLRVVGGNDLGSLARVGHSQPAQVDLVAVVLGRVVRRGHHDAGISLQATQRECEDWCGAVRLEENRPPTRACDHSGRVTSELLGIVTGVVTNDDAEALADTVLEISRQTRGGSNDDDPIHPVGATAEATA